MALADPCRVSSCKRGDLAAPPRRSDRLLAVVDVLSGSTWCCPLHVARP
jgi:hypothetical protein